LHHTEDSNTGDGVTKKDGDRTSMGESTGDTEEETGTDCSTKSDKLDVSRLEATLDISVLLGSLDVAVDIGSLANVVTLVVDNVLDALVVGRLGSSANGILVLLVVDGRHLEMDGVLTEG
jgi:hypothetical protein